MEKDLPPELLETKHHFSDSTTVSAVLPPEEHEKLMEMAVLFDGSVSETLRALIRDSQGLAPVLPSYARAEMDNTHEVFAMLEGRAESTVDLFRGYLANVEADLEELELRARNLVKDVAQAKKRISSTKNKGVPPYLTESIRKAGKHLDKLDESLTLSYTHKLATRPNKARSAI